MLMPISMNSTPNEPTMAWYVLPTAADSAQFESTTSGLSGMEAARRLAVHRLNELLVPPHVSRGGVCWSLPSEPKDACDLEKLIVTLTQEETDHDQDESQGRHRSSDLGG